MRTTNILRLTFGTEYNAKEKTAIIDTAFEKARKWRIHIIVDESEEDITCRIRRLWNKTISNRTAKFIDIFDDLIETALKELEY